MLHFGKAGHPDVEDDIHAIFDRGEMIRKFSFADDWLTLRIGLLMGINSAQTITGPVFAFGVNSGVLKGYGEDDCIHFVGVHSTTASWNYNDPSVPGLGGPPEYYSTGGQLFPMKKVGTVKTNGSGFGSVAYISARGRYYPMNALILQIVKGSPNYTLTFAHPGSASSAQSHITDGQFVAMIEAANMSDIATIESGYVVSSPINLAVDEATNGILDSICICWNSTNLNHLELSSIRARKVA